MMAMGSATHAVAMAPSSSQRRPVWLSPTLSAYLGRQVLFGIGIALFSLAAIALVIDTVELLRRASSRPQTGFSTVVLMAWLHWPFWIQKLMPFAVLFGTMFSFQRLTRSHELVAVRSAGVSVWQFLFPALLVAAGLGAFTVLAFNPLAAVMVARYQVLEAAHLSDRSSLVTVALDGLWLRQPQGDGELLLHAREMTRKPPVLKQVMVFSYEDEVRFAGRVDAEAAHLEPGVWRLVKPVFSHPDGSRETRASHRIPTDLTPGRIQESFASPETMSFWDLPDFIQSLRAVGFSAREHRLYWHGLLALPLLLCAVLLIGTTFSLRLVRRGGTGLLVTGGLITGFAFYALSDVVMAIGLSGRLPAALAAWTPAGVAVLLGLTTLLHLEDG